MGCITIAPGTGLSRSFYAQKGNLPWPSDGAVIESFGTQVNPVYGTKVHNPGILISTTSFAAVKSVYEGKVADIYTMPEFGHVVSINHGEYTSLYGNLSEWYVKPGAIVEAGEIIGTSGTEDAPKGPGVFFALFRNGVETDPEPWLKAR